jgi:hypothetical protein
LRICMTESVVRQKPTPRGPRRSNVKSILKAAKEVGAASVDFGGIVVRLTESPPVAPNTETDDIKSLL